MIIKDFTFCSVSYDTDFKIIGVELEMSDLPGQRIELTGRITSIEAIGPDANMQLHINGQTRRMLLTEQERDFMTCTTVTRFQVVIA